MNKTKLAVIGSLSMVGSRFCELASSDFGLIRADLHGKISVDITQKDSVYSFFENHSFACLILFSAFTDVDAAEKQRNDKSGSCWKINVDGPKNVAYACQKYHRKLIFISSDFVYDGTKGPYREEDPPGPNFDKVSWYGITKFEAESLIKSLLYDYIILRIAYPYRSQFRGKDDLARRILRLYRQGQLYPLFTDQIITPTFIDDLAPAIDLLLVKKKTGIFHLASPKTTTQYNFAKELITISGGNLENLKKESIKKFLSIPGSTPRPVNGGLKVDKIIKCGFTPTDWTRGIEEIFNQSKGELL